MILRFGMSGGEFRTDQWQHSTSRSDTASSDTIPFPMAAKFLAELRQIRKLQYWRSMLLEAVVSGVWVFSSILIISNSGALWGNHPMGRRLLVNGFFHTIFFIIYLCAVVYPRYTEGNLLYIVFLNPAITVLLVLRGFQGPVAGLLAIVGQCAGSVVGGLSAKELLSDDRRHFVMMAGCFHKRELIVDGEPRMEGLSDHQGFLADFIFSFTFLYVGLLVTTPTRLKTLGVLRLVLVFSSNIGFVLYISSSARLGYSGAMFNPARCLGSAVAYGQPLWDRLWVPVVAPLVASFAVALLDAIEPPEDSLPNAVKPNHLIKLAKIARRRGLKEAMRQSMQVEGDLENNGVER